MRTRRHFGVGLTCRHWSERECAGWLEVGERLIPWDFSFFPVFSVNSADFT
jgi:hypothetical protein